jgi:hypothetical protein
MDLDFTFDTITGLYDISSIKIVLRLVLRRTRAYVSTLVDKRARWPRAGRCFGFLRQLAEMVSTDEWEHAVVRPSKKAFSTRAPRIEARNSEVAIMQPEEGISSQMCTCQFGRRATSLRQETA